MVPGNLHTALIEAVRNSLKENIAKRNEELQDRTQEPAGTRKKRKVHSSETSSLNRLKNSKTSKIVDSEGGEVSRTPPKLREDPAPKAEENAAGAGEKELADKANKSAPADVIASDAGEQGDGADMATKSAPDAADPAPDDKAAGEAKAKMEEDAVAAAAAAAAEAEALPQLKGEGGNAESRQTSRNPAKVRIFTASSGPQRPPKSAFIPPVAGGHPVPTRASQHHPDQVITLKREMREIRRKLEKEIENLRHRVCYLEKDNKLYRDRQSAQASEIASLKERASQILTAPNRQGPGADAAGATPLDPWLATEVARLHRHIFQIHNGISQVYAEVNQVSDGLAHLGMSRGQTND